MKRQRGNQLYLAGGAVLVVVAIVVGFLWYVGEVREEAHAQGVAEENGRWQAREAITLQKHNVALSAAYERVRALERQAADDLAALDAEHEKDLARVQADRDRFLDDLVSGRVRFGARDTASARGTDGAGCTAAAPAGARHEAADGELPPALARVAARGGVLLSEADEVTLALTEAQGIIESYRKRCSAP